MEQERRERGRGRWTGLLLSDSTGVLGRLRKDVGDSSRLLGELRFWIAPVGQFIENPIVLIAMPYLAFGVQ